MHKLFVGAVLLLSILVGCTSENSFAPVPIDTSVDSCEECHMGIQDVQASSQVLLKDGTPKKFDDIGCMLLFLKDNKEQAATIYVHDHVTQEWIDMNEAIFVQDSMIATPMSYGFVAFSSEDDAKAFQTENGGKIYQSVDVLNVDVAALKADGHGHDMMN